MTTAQLVVALAGGAAAGALLTALTSLFAGRLSRQHDQRRWLLDKRLEAYVQLDEAVIAWIRLHSPAQTPMKEDLIAGQRALLQALDRITLLGPWNAAGAATQVAKRLHRVDAPSGVDASTIFEGQDLKDVEDFIDVVRQLAAAEVQGIGTIGDRRWWPVYEARHNLLWSDSRSWNN